jgi:hypothetical protein
MELWHARSTFKMYRSISNQSPTTASMHMDKMVLLKDPYELSVKESGHGI